MSYVHTTQFFQMWKFVGFAELHPLILNYFRMLYASALSVNYPWKCSVTRPRNSAWTLQINNQNTCTRKHLTTVNILAMVYTQRWINSLCHIWSYDHRHPLPNFGIITSNILVDRHHELKEMDITPLMLRVDGENKLIVCFTSISIYETEINFAQKLKRKR